MGMKCIVFFGDMFTCMIIYKYHIISISFCIQVYCEKGRKDLSLFYPSILSQSKYAKICELHKTMLIMTPTWDGVCNKFPSKSNSYIHWARKSLFKQIKKLNVVLSRTIVCLCGSLSQKKP